MQKMGWRKEWEASQRVFFSSKVFICELIFLLAIKCIYIGNVVVARYICISKYRALIYFLTEKIVFAEELTFKKNTFVGSPVNFQRRLFHFAFNVVESLHKSFMKATLVCFVFVFRFNVVSLDCLDVSSQPLFERRF